jgi:hypothetical protein
MSQEVGASAEAVGSLTQEVRAESTVTQNLEDQTSVSRIIMTQGEQLIIEVVTQSDGDRSDTEIIVDPAVGYEHAQFSSDGAIVTGTIDGRPFEPVPVNADEGRLKFADGGKPAFPQINRRYKQSLDLLVAQVQEELERACELTSDVDPVIEGSPVATAEMASITPARTGGGIASAATPAWVCAARRTSRPAAVAAAARGKAAIRENAVRVHVDPHAAASTFSVRIRPRSAAAASSRFPAARPAVASMTSVSMERVWRRPRASAARCSTRAMRKGSVRVSVIDAVMAAAGR